jgi:hypothetical protein
MTERMGFYISHNKTCFFFPVLLGWRHVSAFTSGNPQFTRYMLFCFEETIRCESWNHMHRTKILRHLVVVRLKTNLLSFHVWEQFIHSLVFSP